MLVGAFLALCMLVHHSSWVTTHIYSTPALLVSATTAEGSKIQMSDFSQAFEYLRQHTPHGARVLASWEYGDAISVLAERTPVIHAQASNCTPIANATSAAATHGGGVWTGCMQAVARTLLSPHDAALRHLAAVGAEYVLVVFGGYSGYKGDDLDKLSWIERFARCNWQQGIGAFFSFLQERRGGCA